MPMFYGVIGGTGLMLAALTLLMAGQMASSLRTIGHTADASSLSNAPVRAPGALPSPQLSARRTNP
ncbi:hypothetical protein [Methylobacterium sp. J-077]|uniref:hypothetical protein n=1 Tax=Methylobacterium sp. J-077 TaxID=2836656 RepID=UPI001FB8EA60|nr:hypothetical protein [Methylobacterium sp. J-077]MCJ2124563.1 hypothetical protein [Methylobacterium sp. J-077]